jgi:hypothetical protein
MPLTAYLMLKNTRRACLEARAVPMQLLRCDRRPAMWYYPADFVLGKRDVVGAWLVCLVIAAACFGLRALTAFC